MNSPADGVRNEEALNHMNTTELLKALNGEDASFLQETMMDPASGLTERMNFNDVERKDTLLRMTER